MASKEPENARYKVVSPCTLVTTWAYGIFRKVDGWFGFYTWEHVGATNHEFQIKNLMREDSKKLRPTVKYYDENGDLIES